MCIKNYTEKTKQNNKKAPQKQKQKNVIIKLMNLQHLRSQPLQLGVSKLIELLSNQHQFVRNSIFTLSH